MRRIFTEAGTIESALPAAELLTPGIDVTVYSVNGVFGFNGQIDINDSLIRVTTNKTKSNPYGTATLTLTAGSIGQGTTFNWVDILMPMDLVVIRMARSGPDYYTVFVGYVDTVEESLDVSSSTNPSRSISVTAYDLMVGLSDANVFAMPGQIVPVNQQGSWLNAFGALQNVLQQAQASYSYLPEGWLALWLSALNLFASAQLTPTQIFRYIFQTGPKGVVHQPGLLSILFNPITTGGPWGGPLSYIDMLWLALGSTENLQYAAYNISPTDGSIYNTIRSFTNPPFYEFFGDIREAGATSDLIIPSGSGSVNECANASRTVPITWGDHGETFYVVFRQTPFSADTWSMLVQQKIPIEDLQSYTVSRSRDSVVNMYMAYPEGYNQQLLPTQVQLIYGAIVDQASILKYGLSPLKVPLYGLIDTSNTNISFQMDYFINTWGAYLYEWYAKNPLFLSGTMTVAGNPIYRIGERVLLDSSGAVLQGYVEGVQHDFSLFKYYQTAITVSRGATVPDSQATPYKSTYNVGVLGSGDPIDPASLPPQFRGAQ